MAYGLPIVAVTGEVIAASWGNAVRNSLAETAPAKAAAAGDIFEATGVNAIQRVALGNALEVRRINSGGTAWEYSDLSDKATASDMTTQTARIDDEVVHRIMNY